MKSKNLCKHFVQKAKAANMATAHTVFVDSTVATSGHSERGDLHTEPHYNHHYYHPTTMLTSTTPITATITI